MRADLIFLTIICLFFSLSGGAVTYHPDSVLPTALRTFIENGWNPHFFNYPGLVIYLNAILYYVLFQALNLFGRDLTELWQGERLSEASNLIDLPVEISLLFPAHLVTTFFSTVGVVCTYLTTYELTRKRMISLVAALFVCTSFIWISHSHYLTVDIPLAALCIATVWLTLLFTQNKTPLTSKQLIVLGIALGLTASAKYNGAIAFLPILVSLGLNRSNLLLKSVLIVIAASAITFIVTNPFVVLDPESRQSFIQAILFEVNHAKTGHFGFETENGLLFHLTNSLYFGYGIIPLILSLVGGVWLFYYPKITAVKKLAIATFPISFYLVVASSKLAFHRYMLPLIPFLAIASAFGVDYIMTKLRDQKKMSGYFVAIAAIALSLNLLAIAKHNHIIATTDTRTELSQILNAAGLDNTQLNIYTGGYTRKEVLNANLSLGEYFTNRSQKLDYYQQGFAQIRKKSDTIDLKIFDSFSHDRLLYSQDATFKSPIENDESLFVIQLSPFTLNKSKVPFSPESLYSPYFPDLLLRNKPGPYIEIYTRNESLAKKIAGAGDRQGINCSLLPGKMGFYLQEFQRVDEETRQIGKRQRISLTRLDKDDAKDSPQTNNPRSISGTTRNKTRPRIYRRTHHSKADAPRKA